MRRKILVLLLILVIAASQSNAYASDPPIIQSGYKYISKGYYKNAIPVFDKAVKQYPNSSKAHYGLALSAFKQGGQANLELATTHFRKTIEIDPSNIEALSNLARILSWSSSTRDESIRLYEKALQLNPTSWDIKAQYAETLTWANLPGKAVGIYKDLYNANPRNIQLSLNYANALSASENYQKAMDLYNKLISSKAKLDDYTYLNYAKALRNTGSTQEASKIYNNLLSKAKTTVQEDAIKRELSSALFDEKKFEESIAIDKTVSNKDNTTLLRMARAYASSGHKSEAMKIFENLYSKNPNDLEIKKGAAYFLASLGGYNLTSSNLFKEICKAGDCDYQDKLTLAYLYGTSEKTKDQAIELYRSLLNDSSIPSNKVFQVKQELARQMANIENLRPDSADIYRELLTEDPNNLDLKLEFLDLLSWQPATRRESLIEYSKLMDQYPDNTKIQTGFNQILSWYLPTESDLDFYRELLRKYPDNLNALKALAYITSNNPKSRTEALDIYRKLLKNDPGNVEIQIQMADILASDKEHRKESIDLFRKILSNKPDDIKVMAQLADNLLYEKEFKESKEIYDKILSQQPENKNALLGKARMLSWQGLNLAAIKAYEVAYNKYPTDPDIAYEYAAVAKKLGLNAKALEIIKSIGSKSALPDAPIIAMAGAFEAVAIDDANATDNADLDKLQNDLAEIQKNLEKLQQQLKSIETTTNSTPIVESHEAKSGIPIEVVKMEYKNDKLNSSLEGKISTVNSVKLNDINSNNDVLPDPVLPNSEYSARISTLQNTDMNPVMKNLGIVNSITLYSDEYNHNVSYISGTGMDDTLSGKRSMILQNQFNDLEKDVMYEMRPELKSSFILSNEQGNPTSDAMEMYGIPSMLSVNITPQNRFRFGFGTYTYGMTTAINPASVTNNKFTFGLTSRPHQRLLFDGELSLNDFSEPRAPFDVTGNASVSLKLHDRLSTSLAFRREPLYQSVFETTGYRLSPQYTPSQLLGIFGAMSSPLYYPNYTSNFVAMNGNLGYYNQLYSQFMGQVRDNAVTFQANWTPINKWDVNAGYEYSAVEGERVAHNGRHQVMASVGRSFNFKDQMVRLGYQFLFFGYRKDMSAFPAMTPVPIFENGQAVPVTRQMEYPEILSTINAKAPSPQDVLNWANGGFVGPLAVTRYVSPVDLIRAPQGVQIGGYFSPTQFYLNSLRLDFEGKLFNGRISYKGGGSIGVQQIGDRQTRNSLLAARGLTGFADIPLTDPRRANATFNSYASTADSIKDTTDPTSLSTAFDLTGFLKVTDFLSLFSGIDYINSGAYDRWAYQGGIVLRPNIKAFSPMFRKPSATSTAPAKSEADGATATPQEHPSNSEEPSFAPISPNSSTED